MYYVQLECVVCNCIVYNWNILCVIVCVLKWSVFWEIRPIFHLKRPGFECSNYRWMQPNYRWIRPNFGFLKDSCSFHMSNAFRLNFSEFSENRRDLPPPNFLLTRIFKPWWWHNRKRKLENSIDLITTMMTMLLISDNFCSQHLSILMWCVSALSILY
jgi:hypothetical protein